MIQGTASDVGKSVITTAICRLLHQEGISVAPFKMQNMTNETYSLKDKKEIALSQAIQAYAARVMPSVWMNPIVITLGYKRPSEFLLLGERDDSFSGNIRSDDFYHKALVMMKEGINQLNYSFDTLVLEGAGSPVELNLKDKDIVNMKVASVADVPVLLVADISRGGIFASIVGTLSLLSNDERKRVCGIIINKFRGNVSLFQDGVRMIEEKTNIPVVGVIPYLEDNLIQAIETPPQQTSTDLQNVSLYHTYIDKLADIVKTHLNWDDVKRMMKRWNNE